MGNSKGNYYSTPQRTMAAYDQLPPSARKALQDAMFCWATQPIRTKWNKSKPGFRTGHEIAASIEKWDKDHARKTRKRTWGID